MRRRVKKEVGTILGIAVVLGILVFANNTMRRGDLAERMIKWRQEIESKQEKSGLELLKWPIIMNTKGNLSRGARFDEELLKYDGQRVNLIGFQVPNEEFRDMRSFLLLPMPIECYFCQSPPPRDVVLVHMEQGETAPLLKEPVVINGVLQLNRGKTEFFYTIKDAKWGPGLPDMKTNRRSVPIEHQKPHNLEEGPLLEGIEPPVAPSLEDTPALPNPTSPSPVSAPSASETVTPSAEPATLDGNVAPAPETPPAAPSGEGVSLEPGSASPSGDSTPAPSGQ